MTKTEVICDACCSVIKKESVFMEIENLDLCGKCCSYAIQQYLQSRKKKELQSTCSACLGTGKVQEVDEYASSAQASCGENRTQYRTVKCKKCEF